MRSSGLKMGPKLLTIPIHKQGQLPALFTPTKLKRRPKRDVTRTMPHHRYSLNHEVLLTLHLRNERRFQRELRELVPIEACTWLGPQPPPPEARPNQQNNTYIQYLYPPTGSKLRPVNSLPSREDLLVEVGAGI